MSVRHWNVENIKAESFTGEPQSQVLTAVYTWFQLNPGVGLLNIQCSVLSGFECMTVFYE